MESGASCNEHFTYGEAAMAWTERSEVKVDGSVGHRQGLDFLGREQKGKWFWRNYVSIYLGAVLAKRGKIA